MTTTNDLIAEAARIICEPDDDAREAKLEAWLNESGDKLLRLRHVARAAMAQAALYDDEAHVWSTRASREKATAERCDARARDLLEAERRAVGFGEDQPYTADLANGLKARLVLCPPSVVIVDPAAIPAGLWREPKVPAPEPDKVAIRERIESGESVPGCQIRRGLRFEWSEPRKGGKGQ